MLYFNYNFSNVIGYVIKLSLAAKRCNIVLMHFKILVVFAFILHIYLHLCKATNLYRLLTIIFYGSKATFMVYLKIIYYIYTLIKTKIGA